MKLARVRPRGRGCVGEEEGTPRLLFTILSSCYSTRSGNTSASLRIAPQRPAPRLEEHLSPHRSQQHIWT